MISKQIILQVRETGSPIFLRIHTARYKEHVGPGEDFHAGYRSEAELSDWKSKDPLIQETELIEKFRPEIEIEINEALLFAEKSGLPTKTELLTDVI